MSGCWWCWDCIVVVYPNVLFLFYSIIFNKKWRNGLGRKLDCGTPPCLLSARVIWLALVSFHLCANWILFPWWPESFHSFSFDYTELVEAYILLDKNRTQFLYYQKEGSTQCGGISANHHACLWWILQELSLVFHHWVGQLGTFSSSVPRL